MSTKILSKSVTITESNMEEIYEDLLQKNSRQKAIIRSKGLRRLKYRPS